MSNAFPPSPFPTSLTGRSTSPARRAGTTPKRSSQTTTALVSVDLSPRVYTPEQAAQVLAVSRSAVYAAMRDGSIPYVQIGRGARRIPIAAIDALLRVDGREVVRDAA